MPDDNKFVSYHSKMIPFQDWLNTEAMKKPPTIVITRESLSNTFLMDIRYADFSAVLDIPNGYPKSKCYIVPPYKPLSYISFHPHNAKVSVYALRGNLIQLPSSTLFSVHPFCFLHHQMTATITMKATIMARPAASTQVC